MTHPAGNHLRNYQGSQARPGFTLVELLVAVAILAFGAFVTMSMHVSSLKGKQIAASASFANIIAVTEFERLKTLSFADLLIQIDSDVSNLNSLSQPCVAGQDCSDNIFTRRVKFYPKKPTAMSCTVEIEVSWQDSAGPHSTLYNAVISTTSFS
ncbi:MAG: prepilin-type N-terminal cleavage/methylation domain-containing protein [Deltaproteobacteria bacterium]|jgi:prepilin-type N-terminal cleavage/methylation domain-containing protein|nr:prepilin-type N-terminal cleavage/methylation domain-containing protein [Deltaproteobacteria bacterium]